MAIEFLVKARARKIYNKGAIGQTVKASPAIWGGKECLPDFLVFCINDATKDDILPYTKFWGVDYVITDDGDFTTITCPDLDKPNRALPTQEAFNKFYAALLEAGVPAGGIIQYEDTHTTVTKELSTEQIRDMLNDSFNDIHQHRRFTLSDEYIDSLVLTGDDKVIVSLQEFQSNIVDGAD